MAAKFTRSIAPWLDVFAIIAWGGLFLKYWLTGKLYLLIHPNYVGLTVVSGGALLVVGGLRALALLRQALRRSRKAAAPTQHLTLLPSGWSSVLLLTVALMGLIISPQAFASQTALDRGVTDTLTLTRVKPQAFRASSNPEEKSIIDWVRTLTVYPEPDAYAGQKAKVQGFVVHPPNLSNQYLLISRFVITCCAADAYPISLPVKLSQSRDAYKPDSWQEVEGQMITETLDGKRQLVSQPAARHTEYARPRF